jgi:hypothetical protein
MAWHKILALGFLAGAVAVGCTVTSSDGDDDDAGGGGNTGGTTATGGSTSDDGGSTGGSSSGGSSSGGASATGGSGGGGGTFECNPDDETSMCNACTQAKCCDELQECAADPDCYEEVGDTIEGELPCIIACTDDVYDMMGAVTQEDVLECAGACATADNGIIATSTNDIIGCMNAREADAGGATQCGEDCLNTGI